MKLLLVQNCFPTGFDLENTEISGLILKEGEVLHFAQGTLTIQSDLVNTSKCSHMELLRAVALV